MSVPCDHQSSLIHVASTGALPVLPLTTLGIGFLVSGSTELVVLASQLSPGASHLCSLKLALKELLKSRAAQCKFSPSEGSPEYHGTGTARETEAVWD